MTNRPGPRNLHELRAVSDPQERVAAAEAFLRRVREARRDALEVRDAAIRELVALHGPSEAARRSKRSLSTVKTAMRAQS